MKILTMNVFIRMIFVVHFMSNTYIYSHGNHSFAPDSKLTIISYFLRIICQLQYPARFLDHYASAVVIYKINFIPSISHQCNFPITALIYYERQQ